MRSATALASDIVFSSRLSRTPAQKGLPAFGIYGHDVQDLADNTIPADVAGHGSGQRHCFLFKAFAHAALTCVDSRTYAYFRTTITVTSCWCYGGETMDMNPYWPKAVWGFNGTERPGAVYLTRPI